MKSKILLSLLVFSSIVFCASLNAQSIEQTRVPSFQIAGHFQGVRAIRDLTYKQLDGRQLQLDIAFPFAEAPKNGYPLIVYFHGGAWSGGRRVEGYGMFPDEVKYYTSKGIAVATVSYAFINDKRTIADCIVDCKDSIRFLVKNAKPLKINPEKIGVYGHSAGGHLSMMVALADNNKFIGDSSLKNVNFKIACAVPMSGPSDFLNEKANYKGRKIYPQHKRFFIGHGEDNIESEARLASPSQYVSKKSPPMLIINGEKDELVSPNAALFMGELAKKYNAPFEVYIVPNARHSFEEGNHLKILNKRRTFFFKHLLGSF